MSTLSEHESNALASKIAIAILAMVIGGVSGVSYHNLTNNPRPDPFYGAQGRELAAEDKAIRADMARLAADFRADLGDVEAELQKHLIIAEDVRSRLSRAERDIVRVDTNCQKIEKQSK